MSANADDRMLLDEEFVQVDFAELDSLSEDVRLHPNDDMMGSKQQIDCASEKTFWKYARSILYLNAFISPFRALIYMVICLFCLLFCEYKKSKDAAGETTKSILVLFAALAAVSVTKDLVEISNCIADVLFEFVVGGLTLQICLGLGDALIKCVLDCSVAHLTVAKILESIIEPIVFFGGFFSIYLYSTAEKRTLKAQHAKYSAIGNIVGSTIAVTLASFLCFRCEAEVESLNHHVKGYTPAAITDDIGSKFEHRELNFDRDVMSLYDKKNSILAMNFLARIFAEGIVKCVEHKFTKKMPK